MEVGPGQSEEEAVTCTEVVQSEGKSSSLSCEEVVLYRPHDDVITLGADLSWYVLTITHPLCYHDNLQVCAFVECVRARCK